SLYSNQQQAARLANLQNIHFPLAHLSDETSTAFKAQAAQYETAFFKGDADQSLQANQLSSRILDLLQLMAQVASLNPALKVENSRISTLGDQYKQFSQLAAKISPSAQPRETDLEMQKNVQLLGVMKNNILNELNTLTEHFFHDAERIIQEERQHAQSRTVFLGILFTLVLVSATLISRCFANRQLIAPLNQLQDMVTRFAQNREISPPPEKGGKNDEINTLTAAFWNMTQELRQTMVSRDYVDNIIKHMSGCLMVLSADQTLNKINDNTKTFLGFQEEELLGHRISEFVSIGSKVLFTSKGLDALARGQDVSNLEISLLTREKKEIPVLFSASVMRNTDQRVDAIICVAYDITQRKKTEEILRKIEVERALAKTT
ncbi:MAG: PAS domain-containing protein, partial [Flavobacteriaceae bacterium]|nr:PAS domain-containing protein [Flavobacteriaceae bacterium]